MPDDETEIVIHTEQRGPEIDWKVEFADEATIRIEKAGVDVFLTVRRYQEVS